MLSLVPNWQESRNYRDRKAAQVTLYSELQKAHTEEDVKSIYIKALGLKNHSQGFEDIDIRTKEIWFEAKSGSDTVHKMFTQLIADVRHARLKGKHIPPFLV